MNGLTGKSQRGLVAMARGPWLGACLAIAFTTAHPAVSPARDVRVAADESAAHIVSAAAAGDTVTLLTGVHRGPLRIERAITLRGEPGAVIDGGGRGTVVEIVAPGTIVEDLAIRASGRRTISIDSGIHVVLGHNTTIRRVQLSDVLYGIYCERASGVRIEDSQLIGRVTPMTQIGKGNGIHLWYSNDIEVVGNTVERFLDGIYLSFAHRTHVGHNRLRDNGRYGLHTMYCQQNLLDSNLFTRNVAGCAIMFSNHLRIENNDVIDNRGPRTYGFLLRDCSDGRFTNNRMVNNTIAMFMDNSNRNELDGNLFQDNGWGLLMFSSCSKNQVAGNTFIGNDYPVALDMRRSDNQFDDGARGNFWSSNVPYDLDADGLSDIPYTPVSAFAFLSKQYPDLSILAKSPAVSALSVAERVIPALRPSEVVDRFPLLRPVTVTGMGDHDPRTVTSESSWVALLAFALLSSLGMRAMWRGWRAR